MSDENLYTMVLDYKGGTYISQISSKSPEVAIKKWVSTINEQELANWGLTRSEATLLAKDNPIPLKNCSNVWCVQDSAKAGLMLLNIIATQTT